MSPVTKTEFKEISFNALITRIKKDLFPINTRETDLSNINL